ncbi:hypothetical protein L3Q82_026421, partial [Scortum barcoo]
LPGLHTLGKMMEEVSVMMAYDAQVMDQMSEEEILACLVAETGPVFTVPTKKAKLGESLLQIMDDENPLDTYLKENRQLQQASLRLEQENDNLAHRLITSKVTLRNALDKAEDRVDELTKELLKHRHRLQATEEEKRGKEEEAAMLKEMLRRELEKAEQEVTRSSGIIADYKQICSQLTKRLEREQAAHREKLDSLKSAVKACSCCQHVMEADEPSTAAQHLAAGGGHAVTDPGQDKDSEGPRKAEQRGDDQEKESLRAQVRELEQELAQTKLQMVEAKCKIQELEHQRGILASELQDAKNSWISKAFTSLRTSSGGGLHSVSIPKDEALMAATIGGVRLVLTLLMCALGGQALDLLRASVTSGSPPSIPEVRCWCPCYPNVTLCSWPEPTHSARIHYIATYSERHRPTVIQQCHLISPSSSSALISRSSPPSERLWHCHLPNLKLLTDYILNVTAVHSNRSSSHLSNFMLEDVVKPDPPVNVRASPYNARNLLVEWSPPPNWANLDILPLKYQLLYQWENRGIPKSVNLGPFENTNIELERLTPGRTYWFQVCAKELLGLGECSDWSSPVNVTMPPIVKH